MYGRLEEDLKYDCQFVPKSLEQLCLSYVSDKIVQFCRKKPWTNDTSMRSSVSPSSSNSTSSPDSPIDSSIDESAPKVSLNTAASNNVNTFPTSKLLENVQDERKTNSNQDTVFTDDGDASIDFLHEVFLPTRVAENILSKMNENRCINNDTLKYFRDFRTRIKHFKVQDCKGSTLSENGLTILNEHDLKSLRLISLSGIGLDQLVNKILNHWTVRNLELLDLSGTLRTAHYRLMNDSSFSKSPCYHDAILGNVSPSFLGQFVNLRTLIVARSHLDDFALTEICKYLQFIEYLDISSTLITRLEPLLNLKDRLTTLIAQKHRFKEPQNVAQILSRMAALQVLDISVSPKSCSALSQANAAANGADSFRLGLYFVQFLAENPSSLQKLRILDISGGQANFQINAFESFIEARPRLEFCGLLMSNACYFDCVLSKTELRCYLLNKNYVVQFSHTYSNLDFSETCKPSSLKTYFKQVCGEADKTQVFCALETYWSRDYFCSKTMYLLFRLLEMEFDSFSTKDKYFCIQYIVKGLAAHRSNLSVQMAGTACLYNLCREDRAQSFHPSIIRDIVDCCITAIEYVPITLQLHKNVWLTLCNDYILQSGAFDMFRCCVAALESMVKCDDAQVTRITVAIVSILAAKIPTELTTRLGSNRTYMKFLLRVVNQKIESRMAWLVSHGLLLQNQQQQQLALPLHQVDIPVQIQEAQDVDMIDGNNNVPQQNAQPAPPVIPPADLTLKFTLSALWNLTDESPATCSVFLEESGLKSVLRVLQGFQDSSIEAKVLGLLNNVAEVEHLKHRLINNDCLTAIQKLLLSTKIDVSYFAAGILAHLCADVTWDDCKPTWDDCLELLISTIRSWEKPRSEMVAYRSFKPFFHLLSKWTLPAVQYWALWAIHHVCSNNKERYVPLMIKEGGKTVLERVRDSTLVKYPDIYILCNNILNLLC